MSEFPKNLTRIYLQAPIEDLKDYPSIVNHDISWCCHSIDENDPCGDKPDTCYIREDIVDELIKIIKGFVVFENEREMLTPLGVRETRDYLIKWSNETIKSISKVEEKSNE